MGILNGHFTSPASWVHGVLRRSKTRNGFWNTCLGVAVAQEMRDRNHGKYGGGREEILVCHQWKYTIALQGEANGGGGDPAQRSMSL